MVFTRGRCLLSNCAWTAVLCLLDVSGGQLGVSWAPLGPNLGAVGRNSALCDASWAQLGVSKRDLDLQLALQLPFQSAPNRLKV